LQSPLPAGREANQQLSQGCNPDANDKKWKKALTGKIRQYCYMKFIVIIIIFILITMVCGLIKRKIG